MSNHQRLILPVCSWDPVSPGEETVVIAHATYTMLPDEIYFDPRSWVVRRAYLLGGLGSETELALLPGDEPPEAWPGTKSSPARFAPGTRVTAAADLRLLVSYVGASTDGDVFHGGIAFYLDWGDPYTRRVLSSSTTCV